MASTSPLYQASGLASGMDTASIVDKLIKAESAPLSLLSTRKAAYNVQVSTIATLTSRLKALQTATDALGASGVTVNSNSSTYSDFTLSGSATTQANYSLQVEKLALAAKARSTNTYSAANDAALVPDGNLQFTIDGTASAVIDTTGKTLAQVASAINDNISSLSASVVNTGSGYVLAVVRKETGYTTTPAGSLEITQDPGLGLSVTQQAQNAKIWLDGLQIDKRSNSITDAIPGVTINLTAASNTVQQLSFSNDQKAAVANLQKFIDGYNNVATLITSQLKVNPNAGKGEELLDGSTMHSLQRKMQQLLSGDPIGTGYARTLADLGVELQKDGTLKLNETQFAKAVANDSTGVNKVFSTATQGITAKVAAMVKQQTQTGTGVLVTRTTALKKMITGIDIKTEKMNDSLDRERTRLTAQFRAMESIIGNMNNISSYLTNLDNSRIAAANK
jgi:flagellar hook-associated protein 2